MGRKLLKLFLFIISLTVLNFNHAYAIGLEPIVIPSESNFVSTGGSIVINKPVEHNAISLHAITRNSNRSIEQNVQDMLNGGSPSAPSSNSKSNKAY